MVEMLKDVGRSLGGKGDAGCPKSEILKYVRWAVDQTSGSSPEGAVLALSELFQETDVEASTANAKDDDDGGDGDEPEGGDEGGGLKTWKKEIKTLFIKLGGLEKIKRWGPLSLVSLFYPAHECAKLIKRCSHGVDDQGAEEALQCQQRIVTSVLEAVCRASGSPFIVPGCVLQA